MSDPITELGRRLLDSGYDEDGLDAALGGIELERARRLGAARPVLVDEPLATLVELFFVVRPVERDAVAAALGPVPVDALVDAGLLVADGEATRRAVPDLALARRALRPRPAPADALPAGLRGRRQRVGGDARPLDDPPPGPARARPRVRLRRPDAARGAPLRPRRRRRHQPAGGRADAAQRAPERLARTWRRGRATGSSRSRASCST